MTGSKKLFIKTYGCQMNVYDSEKISSFLTKEGMVENNDIYSADILSLIHI